MLVVVAGGTAAGRWRLWAVHRNGAQTGIARDDAVLLVPVPALEVKAGDRVVIGQPGAGPTLYRITGITDSTNAKVQVVQADNDVQEVALPAKVWRVSYVLPYSGVPLRLLAGPVQAALLVLGGIAIIAEAERRRHAVGAPAGATTAVGKVSAST
jgi:hypothetical protein